MIEELYNTNSLSDSEKESILNILKNHDAGRNYNISESIDNYDNTLNSHYIYKIDNELIGYVNIFAPDNSSFYIYPIIHNDYRNKGFFKKLLNYTIDEIKSFLSNSKEKPTSPLTFILPLVKDGDSFDDINGIYTHLCGNAADIQYIMSLDFNNARLSSLNKTSVTKTPTEKNNYMYKIYDNKEGKLIGYFALYFDEENKTITLYRLFIKPQFRKNHFAYSTLTDLILTETKNGYKKLILQVSDRNKNALGLYNKLGFNITSEERFFLYDN
ncbi:Acetyltransferase (GNAT) family protein [Lachnospiraceae bacterium RM5]|nr:Acetyltransferase (GNAT) family protein [Lachnospiraceae bacterium RM5]